MEKTRFHVIINTKIFERFRKRCFRKKGDISKKIEELIIKEMKGGNSK